MACSNASQTAFLCGPAAPSDLALCLSEFLVSSLSLLNYSPDEVYLKDFGFSSSTQFLSFLIGCTIQADFDSVEALVQAKFSLGLCSFSH